jgi:hypothetical protein
MIEAERRHQPPAVPFPAQEPAPEAPAVPAAPAVESAAAPVSLSRRFFNVKTLLSFLLGLAILVTLFRVTDVNVSEIVAQLRAVDPRVYAMAALCTASPSPAPSAQSSPSAWWTSSLWSPCWE